MKNFRLLFVTLAFVGLSMNNVNAQFAGGDGSVGDPYQIATAKQLAKLAELVNAGDAAYTSKCYILTADIDLIDYQSGQGWTPIGVNKTGNDYFSGHFDGNGKTITNLYINSLQQKAEYLGLFGIVVGGTVKKLCIKGIRVVFINSDVTDIGGIVGVLANNASISHCCVSGYIEGKKCVGGIVGFVNFDCSVSNCYSTAIVRGEELVGGIAGYVSETSGIGKVFDCAALNPYIERISGTNTDFGRIAGFSGGTLSNNIAFDGMEAKGGITFGAGAQGNKDGADFSAVQINGDGTLGGRFTSADGWTTENGKLPAFGNAARMPYYLQLVTGTETDPYLINNADDLAFLADYVNAGYGKLTSEKYFKLTDHIDLSDYQTGEGWIPIGASDMLNNYTFLGNFDGNNKKITGLKIINTKLRDVGLFGYVSGVIKNLGIEDANIISKTSRAYPTVGGLVGYINSSKQTDISNCYVTGEVRMTFSGDSRCEVGGIIGGQSGSPITISNCYSKVTVSSNSERYSYAGGLIGHINKSIISNCYSTGTISSSGKEDTNAGGIAGCIGDNTTITNCYSTGAISSVSENKSSRAGGVAGTIYDANTISNCYATGAVSSSSYSSSSGEDAYAGGVVGYISKYSVISNCAALNPSISCAGITDKYFGRVVGFKNNSAAPLLNNIAFDKMKNPDGGTDWSNEGLDKLDGEGWSKEQINADGTLGGRFNGAPWTTANKYLPGLFGKTVPMPEHLGGTGIIETENNDGVRIYPNPTKGELKIENGELKIENVEIYDIFGRVVEIAHPPLWGGLGGLLPSGIYFIRITTDNGVITKKVIKSEP